VQDIRKNFASSAVNVDSYSIARLMLSAALVYP